MAPHSSILAWKIPRAEEPGRLQSAGWLRLSDFTFTFHCQAWEKEMATHSSVLAWRISGTGEHGGLPSMGSHRVGHDWSDLAAAAVQEGYKCICFQMATHTPRKTSYIIYNFLCVFRSVSRYFTLLISTHVSIQKYFNYHSFIICFNIQLG